MSKYLIYLWNQKNSNTKLRIKFIIISFSLIFLILAIRLMFIATNEYSNYRMIANSMSEYRMDITDRNNNLLAVNLPTVSLYANPQKIIDLKGSIDTLLTVVPSLNKQKLLSKLKSNKNFIWVKRDLTPQEHEKIYNLGIPGFGFEREQKRIYTYGNLLSHVIGYVGRDLNGLSGLEQYFNNSLTEQKPISDTLGGQTTSLKLSIDLRVQNILSEEIDKIIKKFKAKGAAGIIANPNNGEILALVSKPDFNPHYPGKASPNQLFNMATQGVYEMGSGMKSLTMAIGLETKSISMQDAYDLSYMNVNGFQVKDYHLMKGWHTVPHIFLKSSNIGVSQIMLEIGGTDLANYLRKLGLLDRVRIELPERGRPLFPPISDWTDLSLTTMSYGYGISVSPLHFMQAMLPVVNGGILHPLTLLKNDSANTPSIQNPRIFSNQTSHSIRQLMRLVVSDGTGSKAEVKGYYVGGKTGTANIVHNGKYDKNRRISSFFGIMPASNPEYMIYIVYNEPQGIKETFGYSGGGWTAAPTAGAIFERIASLYGIEKLDHNSKEIQELTDIEYKIQDET